ncbi:MAG: YcbK family protein [Gammaproteobacteria bacterium]
MSKQPVNDAKIDEDSVASRRKFLKNLAYGSLLALGGSEAATAAVRHVIHPGRHRHHHKHAHFGHTHTRHDQSPIFARHDLHAFEHKTLSFEHTHTGDKLRLTYFERGRYIQEALQEINYLLRDFRTDDIHPIDTALLDQLFVLKHTLGVNKPFHIISGYRSPLTNARLRRHSHGVAEHSLHTQGRAIDIRVEGVSSKTIRNAALTLAQGGVGYYPRENFVHLDTGRFRTW